MSYINKDGAYRTKTPATRPLNNISVITVHHDAIPHSGKTYKELLPSIQATHTKLWGRGAEYHIYIDEFGNIVLVNDFKYLTWHDKKNWNSIAVCLNGYFHPDFNNVPTEAQLKAFKWVLDNLCTQHPEFPADHNDVYGHREIPTNATACPGNLLFPYVKEYRDKRGAVDWGKDFEIEELKKQIELLKLELKDSNEKADYYDSIGKMIGVKQDKWSVTEPTIEKLVEASSKLKDCEKSKKAVQLIVETLESQLNDKNIIINRQEGEINTLQKTNERLEDINGNNAKKIATLNTKIEGYKNQKFSITECIALLLDAIKRKAV